MKKLIVIGGYARAGKSTVVSYLRDNGFEVFSTSEIVHKLARNILSRLLPSTPDTTDKSLTYSLGTSLSESVELSQRTLLIGIAEGIRDVNPLFWAEEVAKLVECSTSDFIAIESVGGEEFDVLVKLVSISFQPINVRRYSELAGVDLRQLLPNALEICNNSTIDNLYTQIDAVISNL